MRRHLLSLRDLPADEIEVLLDLAQACADGGAPGAGPLRPVPSGTGLRGRTVATLFYETSTRTEISFELAARKLGADPVRCDVDRSSVKKGESFLDTVRTLEALGASAIVIRHPSAGAPHLASRGVRAAVINGGDGMHEHPTQGLVDLLTARQRRGRIAGLKVVIVGDVRHSRVARSAVWGFTKLGADVTLAGPPTLLPHGFPALPSPLGEEGKVRMTTSLEEALEGADVVMALRMQLERQAGGDVPSLAEFAARYGLSDRVLALARPDAIVLHPGPMNLGVEVRAEVAYGPRSAIAAQVANGLFVRMAVLLWAHGLDATDYRSTRSSRSALSPQSNQPVTPVPVASAAWGAD